MTGPVPFMDWIKRGLTAMHRFEMFVRGLFRMSDRKCGNCHRELLPNGTCFYCDAPR